MMVTVD